MKLKAQLGDNDHEISLTVADGSATAEIDGRRYQLEVLELSNDVYLLINGTNVFRCRVESKRESPTSFEVALNGRAFDIDIIDPKRLRSGQTSGAHGHGAAEIVSPMPGKVVRLLVEVGQHVEAGAGIVVVEAMKMQNEMKSPKTGTVISINAEAGATVSAGDVLAVIE